MTFNIYKQGTLAGVLEYQPESRFTFCYDAQILKSNPMPVSLSLPVRSEPYTSPYLFPAFSNLLPEGANREKLCQLNKIDEDDDLALLGYLADRGHGFIGDLDFERAG